MGDFAVAAEHLERVVALFEPGAPNVTDLRYSQDHAVFSLTMLALTLFPRGYPQQAAIASAKSLSWAHRIEHAMSVGFALSFGSVLNGFVGADVLEGGQHSVRALAYCVEHDLKAYIPWSRFYHGLALARRGEIRQGIDLMNDGIAGAERISMNMLQSAHLGHLALIHASAGDQEAGLRLLDQAVRMAKETRGHWPACPWKVFSRVRGRSLTPRARPRVCALEAGTPHSVSMRLGAGNLIAPKWANDDAEELVHIDYPH